MSLTTIEGKKINKEPTERMYEFHMYPAKEGSESVSFTSYGVLVVSPGGFVGVGNKDQTEIKSVVPFERIWFVKEVPGTEGLGSTQGSA